MNHYFTINYSFLLHEKSFVLNKATTLSIFENIISSHLAFLEVKYTKYITNSLTTVIKTKLLVIICKT